MDVRFLMDNITTFLEQHSKGWLSLQQESWHATPLKPKTGKECRKTLICLLRALIEEKVAKKQITFNESSRQLRTLWAQRMESPFDSLPEVVNRDPLLRMLVKGEPLSIEWLRPFVIDFLKDEHPGILPPLLVEARSKPLYHPVRPTPQGLMAKLTVRARKIADAKQIEESIENFSELAFEKDPQLRKWQTFATLAHGSAYRELHQKELWLPDFNIFGRLTRYTCEEDLISEGIKTAALYPEEGSGVHGIYLIQGSNPFPSQPHTMASFIENFGQGGSGRRAYEHSWRRIHKTLKKLMRAAEGRLPYIVGHSLGGSLAIQIGLYSQLFAEESFAFNPPMPQEKDYIYFRSLPESSQKKIQIFVNGDDFAFWRLGAAVFGQVYLVYGVEAWNGVLITKNDRRFIFPYLYKIYKNFALTIPSHLATYLLDSHFVVSLLSEEEKALENIQRQKRIDHLPFLPSLQEPGRQFFRTLRRIFSRTSEKRVLKNEIELLQMQEEELRFLTQENPLEKFEKKIAHLQEKRHERELQLKRLEMRKRL